MLARIIFCLHVFKAGPSLLSEHTTDVDVFGVLFLGRDNIQLILGLFLGDAAILSPLLSPVTYFCILKHDLQHDYITLHFLSASNGWIDWPTLHVCICKYK